MDSKQLQNQEGVLDKEILSKILKAENLQTQSQHKQNQQEIQQKQTYSKNSQQILKDQDKNQNSWRNDIYQKSKNLTQNNVLKDIQIQPIQTISATSTKNNDKMQNKNQQVVQQEKFLNSLQNGNNGKKQSNQSLNMSNWDHSKNAQDNPGAFKKKKTIQSNQILKDVQSYKQSREQRAFRRFNQQINQHNNGLSGGRGRSYGIGQNQNRQGIYGTSGGRGYYGNYNQGRQGGRGYRGFDDQRTRGGYEGGRGSRYEGGRGGGERNYGYRGGFGGRGARGGGRGREDFGERSDQRNFGRRDFGENNYANLGENRFRRQDNKSQSDRYSQNRVSEIQFQQQQTFNPAQLSMIEGIPKIQHKSKISNQFRINTTMASQPLGLKCWPSVSVYVKKCKVSLYLSRIRDHNCSVLYFPYSHYCMNLYPGNMVNQFQFDYRKKLREKCKPVGQAYFQRCIGIKNFQVISFSMVSQYDQTTVHKSIQNLFQQASKAQKQILQSVCIPYSLPLDSLKPILKVCFQSIDKYEKFKQIIISTNEPVTFCQASSQFLEVIQQLADNNDLVIQ